MTQEELRQLSITATKVRMDIINETHAAKSGHPGGSMSSADAMTYLYFKQMNIDPQNPHDPERDRFVLSKGHCAPGLYAVLAERGFFPKEDLLTLRHLGSYLQGHPDMKKVPGVDMSTGSLGQGVSAACGMALGLKMKGSKAQVYTLLGDGELEEGEVWEAMMFAAHYKLDNLHVIIDNNNLQIDGEISKVMSPYPIGEKLEAFGLDVQTINGNDFASLEAAFDEAMKVEGKPTAIVMKTTKGKGVSFMENQAGWHGKAPNDEERDMALAELEATLRALEGGNEA